jgi:hypothetical protein
MLMARDRNRLAAPEGRCAHEGLEQHPGSRSDVAHLLRPVAHNSISPKDDQVLIIADDARYEGKDCEESPEGCANVCFGMENIPVVVIRDSTIDARVMADIQMAPLVERSPIRLPQPRPRKGRIPMGRDSEETAGLDETEQLLEPEHHVRLSEMRKDRYANQ